ncbi:hypothetical protein GPECTOR_51g676 [Gonium pectorale]|uniref:BTB domain-containing protein n=1 Tax=Gonium pectorale TaxID=33097 RepID=A0A150G795_GONPE|nr:hypothetical protein GPECTOR_51g676 [Gonium pectorale]|eukprot:KXZ45691.1 hypothetical protein GPECTOR_51g676 [Gonium pectorale]
MLRCSLSLPRPAHGIVVRPAPATGAAADASASASAEASAAGHTANASIAIRGSVQALVLLGVQSCQFRLLEGGSNGEPYAIGAALPLVDRAAPAAAPGGQQLPYDPRNARCPVYDPATDCVYFAEGTAIMRLDGGNGVSLVAGSREVWGSDDGVGADARFWDIRSLTVDGTGSLFVAEPRCIRKVALRPAPSVGSNPAGGWDGKAISRADNGGGSSCTAEASADCAVTTLPNSAPKEKTWVAVAYDASAGELLAATDRAICCLQLPPSPPCASSGEKGGGPTRSRTISTSSVTSISASTAAAGGDSVVPEPLLVAGDWSMWAQLDGNGAAARFHTVYGLLPVSHRRVFVLDNDSVRVMGPQRCVRTLANRVLPAYPHGAPYMAVLPGGCLAVCGSDTDHKLHLIGGGITPIGGPLLAGQVGSPAGARLGKLLALPQPLPWKGGEADPTDNVSSSSSSSSSSRGNFSTSSSDSSWCRNGSGIASRGRDGIGGNAAAAAATAAAAIVAVRVGPRTFLAHRSLLSLRSDYFKHLLAPDSGFAEGAATHGTPFAETELPGADPDAFELLLEHMYTGTLSVPSALLRPTAELAGQLLMPGVCSQLKQQLLEESSAASVVGDLLWAEKHSLTDLLEDLKAFFVRNRREVAEAAPGAVAELAESSPGLAAQLILQLSSAL